MSDRDSDEDMTLSSTISRPKGINREDSTKYSRRKGIRSEGKGPAKCT